MNLVPVTKDTPTLELLRMYWECHRWLLKNEEGPDGPAIIQCMNEANAELHRRVGWDGERLAEWCLNVARKEGIATDDITPEEHAILDERMKDAANNPDAGIPLEELPEAVAKRMAEERAAWGMQGSSILKEDR